MSPPSGRQNLTRGVASSASSASAGSLASDLATFERGPNARSRKVVFVSPSRSPSSNRFSFWQRGLAFRLKRFYQIVHVPAFSQVAVDVDAQRAAAVQNRRRKKRFPALLDSLL